MSTATQRLFFGSRSDRTWSLLLGVLLVAAFLPTLVELVEQWWEVPEYGHGLLMPPVMAWMIWESRRQLIGLRRTAYSGAVAIIASLALVPVVLLLWLGEMRLSWFLKPFAFVAAVTACLGLLYGWRGLKALYRPLVVMLLMCPIPWRILLWLTVPLKRHATVIATGLIDATGLEASLQGNLIHVPGITSLWVADACSGLRSLVSLISLAILGCLFWRRHWSLKAFVIASCIPIAILVNGLRIWLTALLAVKVSKAAADSFWHYCEGFLLFGVAALITWGWGTLLSRLLPRRAVPADEPVEAPEAAPAAAPAPADVPSIAAVLPAVRKPVTYRLGLGVAVVALCVAAVGVYRVRHRLGDGSVDHAAVARMQQSFSRLPLSIESAGYRGEPVEWNADIVETSGADAYRAINYHAPDGRSFQVYLGGALRNADNFHAPNVCMPTANWETLDTASVPFFAYPVRGSDVRMQRLLLQRGEQAMVVYYWFQAGDRLAGDEWAVRFYRLLDLLRDKPLSPTLIVSVYVPVREGVEETRAAARDFLSHIGPYLREATASGGIHG